MKVNQHPSEVPANALSKVFKVFKNPLALLQKPGWRCLLAAFLGALLVFSYAPFSQAWLTVPLLAAWLLLMLRSQTQRQALAIGFAFGFGWFAAGIAWVFVSVDRFGGMPVFFSLLVMTILWAYLALFPMLAAWLWFRLRPRLNGLALLVFPLIWLVTEWLRGTLLTGFPWLGLGYTQVDSQLGQLAPLLGEIGITLLLWLAAIGFCFALLRKQLQWLLMPVIVYALGVAASYHQPVQSTGEHARIAMVQGNIEQQLKWEEAQQWPNLLTYLDLARPYYDHELVIWPESAITAIEPFAQRQLQQLDNAARTRGTAVISGIIDLTERGYYNSVIVLGEQQLPDGSPRDGYRYDEQNRYRKHHLLPIGEFVPFENLLRPLAPLFNLPMSSFSRGDAVQPNLLANGYQLAVNICFETVFSRKIARGIGPDTQFILTVSNDSWFGDSHGPHQHLDIARMRAMEFGRPLLRATNNGVTAAADARGQVIAQLPQFEAAVASVDVPMVVGTTWYHRLGEWPTWLLALLAGGFGWRRAEPRLA